MKNKKKPLSNPVIPDNTVEGPARKHVTQQIKVTDENANKYAAAFIIKIYGRLGYIIKLMEEQKLHKDNKGNPTVI